MKDFKSSDELTARMIALGTGEIKPQDADDEEMLAEYMAIMEADGEIAIPGDLPDPVKKPVKQKRVNVKAANEDIYPLNDRQEALYDELEAVVEDYGVFDKGIGPNGAHYVEAEKNPFKDDGMVCSNCAFYVGPRGCELVKGDIDPNAICKFWIIPETLLVVEEEGRKKSLISSSIHRSPGHPRRKRYLKRIRKVGDKWEKLGEGGISGIDTLPSGGLVSAGFSKSFSEHVEEKAIVRFIPRAGDPDTYTNQESARIRSRQIGCVGIRRYTARGGETVWMPCTTHVTYQKLTSQGAYRNQPSVREGQVRKLVRREMMRQEKKKSLEVKGAGRKARSDRLAATPAPKKDRIVGSSRNRVGSASSISSGSSIAIDPATVESLRKKVKEHNAKVHGTGGWKRTSLGALKSVYRRGAGAFSASHRPNMTRNQWAMGRVNAFLVLLEKGKPNNPRYTTDNDLLSADHPWKKRTRLKSLFADDLEPKEKSISGRIGGSGGARRIIRSVNLDPDANDGDNDGKIQDNTPYERPAPVNSGTRKKKKKAKPPKAGSYDPYAQADENGIVQAGTLWERPKGHDFDRPNANSQYQKWRVRTTRPILYKPGYPKVQSDYVPTWQREDYVDPADALKKRKITKGDHPVLEFYEPGKSVNEKIISNKNKLVRSYREEEIRQTLDGFSDSEIEKAMKLYDVSDRESLVKKIADRAEELSIEEIETVRKKPLYVAITPTGMVQLIKSKRYKTQFEKGKVATGVKQGGYYDPDKRREIEKDLLGIPEVLPDEFRPVYGFQMTTEEDSDSLSVTRGYAAEGYGSVVIKVKDSVRSRATMTGGDSSDSRLPAIPVDGEVSKESALAAAGINDSHRQALYELESAIGKNPAKPSKYYEYSEIQLHGGLSLDDIEEVTFYLGDYSESGRQYLKDITGKPYTYINEKRKGNPEKIRQQLTDALDGAGIKHNEDLK